MSLTSAIADYRAEFLKNVPKEIQGVMGQATQDLAATNIVQQAPNQGDKLLNFNLPNQNGQNQSLEALLEKGPVVVTFYRGGWCPYCNLELRAYQSVLADIKAAGATLVAVTPELPDASLSTTEKNELAFEVLTDKNAEYARALGLVFSLPEELRPIYSSFGIHIEEYNGSGQFDLPLAATYVVSQDGVIRSAFVDADYTKRQEPAEVVEALKLLGVTA